MGLWDFRPIGSSLLKRVSSISDRITAAVCSGRTLQREPRCLLCCTLSTDKEIYTLNHKLRRFSFCHGDDPGLKECVVHWRVHRHRRWSVPTRIQWKQHWHGAVTGPLIFRVIISTLAGPRPSALGAFVCTTSHSLVLMELTFASQALGAPVLLLSSKHSQ